MSVLIKVAIMGVMVAVIGGLSYLAFLSIMWMIERADDQFGYLSGEEEEENRR